MKRCIFESKASPSRACNQLFFSPCRTSDLKQGWLGFGCHFCEQRGPMWLLLRVCHLGGEDGSCKGNVCSWALKCPAKAFCHPPEMEIWKSPLYMRSTKASCRSKIHPKVVCCSAVDLRVFH